MTQVGSFRVVVFAAGLMGAAGVILAAVAAHKAGGTLLPAASSMLLFHAPAALLATLLADRQIVRSRLGLAAAGSFVAGATLFSTDLTMLQFLEHRLFPMAAPTGGTLMILGWLVLAVAAVWPRAKARSDQSGS
ncbi:hypothetical protein NB311A_02722 [Nitrobacter sp. Nb-311A]|uniref:DUF423 domain-containing protein n=1 Tax=unclassified Nitrobacter TaxID=2620411 RepID=UPI0000686837|nr:MULTISPECIES: DUF423 domain-containing protein [unclassified Nitrobacter]EAQ33934.1 hypothetical protein NB311A_02722 [Nitrobacter sp. Nb-311A]MCB1393097.1 DUF423 domain-containing protein [Nitrobacter sp.]MCV0387193.1 DUF423 domain-containing protein [Nitrobacter sp.]